jgi:hypothetical protein
MVIFYTFYQPDFKHKLDHAYFDYLNTMLMLKISVYSVLRELENSITQICIYSNSINKVKANLGIDNHLISYREMPSEIDLLIRSAKINETPDESSSIDTSSHFKMINGIFGTAHSRVFIFSELFNEFKKDVLYLDYDTGICRDAGKELLKKLNSGVIISDMKTADSIAYNILKMYPAFKLEGITDCIDIKTPRWSCGYLFLPISTLTKSVAFSFKDTYLRLLDEIGFMDSHDENAICQTFVDYYITPTLLFESTSWYIVRSPEFKHNRICVAPAIVHYSFQKGHSKYRKQFQEWLIEWEKALNFNLPDPKFEQLKYLDMTSFDFIWGRFETI